MGRFRATGVIAAGLTMAVMLTTGAWAGPASASGRKPEFVCTTLSGPTDGVSTLSGCGGNTGGSGTFPGEINGTPIRVTWSNSRTTTFFWTHGGSHKRSKGCPADTREFTGLGVVTSDTTGSTTFLAVTRAMWCIGSNPVTQAPIEALATGSALSV